MNKQLLLKTLGRSVFRYKTRSLLMMIGIMISVYTLTIGLVSTQKLKADLSEYLLKSFLPNSITLASSRSALENEQLELEDVEAVISTVSGINQWTPIVRGGRRTINYKGSTAVTGLMGLDVSAQQVMGQPVILGEYISSEDIQTRARVILLGTTVALKLFAGAAENHMEVAESSLGRQIEIDRILFTVKGVLKPLGSDPHGGDLDNVIVIPYTTLLQMNKTDKLGNVRFMADDGTNIERIANDINVVMKQQHNIAEGQTDTFYVSTSHEGQTMFDETFSLINLVLSSIVGIIFLISTIVISVIMTISIKERTAEIGLRKAMGATAGNLHLQFLLEALFVSVIGALIGVVISILSLPFISKLISDLMGGVFVLTANPLIVSFAVCCSVVAGLLGGYYPAKKAAAMMPVEALKG